MLCCCSAVLNEGVLYVFFTSPQRRIHEEWEARQQKENESHNKKEQELEVTQIIQRCLAVKLIIYPLTSINYIHIWKSKIGNLFFFFCP